MIFKIFNYFKPYNVYVYKIYSNGEIIKDKIIDKKYFFIPSDFEYYGWDFIKIYEENNFVIFKSFAIYSSFLFFDVCGYKLYFVFDKNNNKKLSGFKISDKFDKMFVEYYSKESNINIGDIIDKYYYENIEDII